MSHSPDSPDLGPTTDYYDKDIECNCIEHFCCGYEAGIALDAKKLANPVSVISFHALAAMGTENRLEGNYAVVVYHHPDAKLFSGTRNWQIGLEHLSGKLGVNITRVVFEATDLYQGYAFGLVED